VSTLGDLAPLISTTGDVIGALGGFGLTIAGVVLQIKAEKKEAVTETHTTDNALAKYGITGGPTTPQDITGAGPLGDLTPLPGGIGGAQEALLHTPREARDLLSSWPVSSRPSTAFLTGGNVDAGMPGHAGNSGEQNFAG
jgi:hypothetical protein